MQPCPSVTTLYDGLHVHSGVCVVLISRDPAMVLERIVASSLQNVLGAYFHGVEDKRLQLDVLSGRVVLRNLRVREDALAALRATAKQNQKRPVLAPTSCGGTPYSTYPNNLYGWGLPDVCSAASHTGIKAACGLHKEEPSPVEA